MKLFLVLLIMVFMVSCSSLFKKDSEVTHMKIQSEPSNAEVVGVDGVKLGLTPLELPLSVVEKYQKSGYLPLTIRKQGFVEGKFLVQVKGIDLYDFKLEPISQVHFNDWLLGSYSKEANGMIRDLLTIQSLMFLKKFPEAKTQITGFSNKYPNVAATHTMMASILINEENPAEARAHLNRALSIDQTDSTAIRMLRMLETQ
jgi:hypothetical protein